MHVLVTGANGFIGSHLVGYLIANGFIVTCAVRDVNATKNRFPTAQVIACDFNKDTTTSDWLPRLDGIDSVINCAGVLAGSNHQSIECIHYHAPMALFQACKERGIKRVIQLSALGIEDGPPIDYVTTKKQADNELLELGLSACVIRPSLVYASGSYGGTSLLRALAAFPGVIPLIGDGSQRFCPIAMSDVVKLITRLISHDFQGIINAPGPQSITLKQLLLKYRQWMGYGKVAVLPIAKGVIKCLAKVGDRLKFSTINTNSFAMSQHENIADAKPVQQLLDYQLIDFNQGLAMMPSQTQDRWHARLYLLKPLIKLSLVFLWVLSGLIPLLSSNPQSIVLLKALGMKSSLIKPAIIATCLWDIILAMAMLFSRRPVLVAGLQFVTVLSYTLVATIGLPHLWLDPLAPLLKNVPIMVLILTWLSIAAKR